MLVEALGGDLRGGQAQSNGAGHGSLQGMLRRAALPGMEVALGDLVLRVIAAGVPWAKRVRFRVSKINMAKGEAETLLMPIRLYAGQEPPSYGFHLIGCAPKVCASVVRPVARQGAAEGRSLFGTRWRLIMDARVGHGVQVMEQTVPSWEGVNGSGPQRGGWGWLEHIEQEARPSPTTRFRFWAMSWMLYGSWMAQTNQ